jgi:hypothetical protein
VLEPTWLLLGEGIMSSHRRNQAHLLNVWNDFVDGWSDEASEGDDSQQSSTGVRRALRDSYTHERPMIAASLDLHAEDLLELPLLEDPCAPIHFRRTLRP